MSSRNTNSPATTTANSTEGGAASSGQANQGKSCPQVRFFFNGLKVNGGKLHKAHLSLIERWTKASGDVVDTHVVLYAPGCSHFAPEVRALFPVENNTDLASDYFETDRIRIPLGHPLFNPALAAVIQAVERDIRRCTKLGKREDAATYERKWDDLQGVASAAARPWDSRADVTISDAASESRNPASERWHVGDRTPDDGDIVILDENRLVVCSLPWGMDPEGDAQQMASARLLAAAPQLLDALCLALTFITDPEAIAGRAAVERRINAALDVAVEE